MNQSSHCLLYGRYRSLADAQGRRYTSRLVPSPGRPPLPTLPPINPHEAFQAEVAATRAKLAAAKARGDFDTAEMYRVKLQELRVESGEDL